MSANFDAIIIGAGHNGLVNAALLAKSGLRVLVLERRNIVGGSAITEEVFPGFLYNTGAHDAGQFREYIVKELNLKDHELQFLESEVVAYAPLSNRDSITIWHNENKTVEEISKFSTRDAAEYPKYLSQVRKYSVWLDKLTTRIPPRLFKPRLSNLLTWVKTAVETRRLGKKDMMELLRILPSTTKEYLDEWFESDALKGLLGAPSVAGSMQGPQASGTAFMLLYHQIGSLANHNQSGRFVKNGIGQLSNALANAAIKLGVEIRCGEDVDKILVTRGKVTGIRLRNGEKISSTIIVSNADPKHTFFELVGATHLEVRIMRRVRAIKFRGSTSKINLSLSGLPNFLPQEDSIVRLEGHIIISPSLDYLERAYDDAKYGKYSSNPYLDIVIPSILDASVAPPNQHVMSIIVQYTPYDLRNGNWPDQREALGNHVVEILSQYAPNIKDLILHKQVITPLDLEQEYGLTEGNIYHGQMGLDQLLFMRPIAGFNGYHSPIDNLYLCGAGTHPGGGVTGVPGYNAAKQILMEI